MQTQQISFAIPDKQYAAMAKRAGLLNLRPAQYAHRLFDAAYAARIAGERGEASGDPGLDRQVRDVFLLADCEPEFIASSLALPEARVKRILDGWRRAAAEIVEPKSAGQPPFSDQREPVAGHGSDQAPAPISTTPLPPPGAAGRDKRSEKAWPADMVDKARVMWGEGRTCAEIGAAIGKTAGNMSVFMSKNRALFPRRRGEA